MEEAIEAAVFDDQAAVSAQDQVRFEQMLRQLEHYLADQVLIVRRRQASLDAQIEEQLKRKQQAAGTQAGDAADVKLKQLLRDREQLSQQIAKIEEGGDDEYRLWRERLLARRYSRPDVRRVLDVRFAIVDAAC